MVRWMSAAAVTMVVVALSGSAHAAAPCGGVLQPACPVPAPTPTAEPLPKLEITLSPAAGPFTQHRGGTLHGQVSGAGFDAARVQYFVNERAPGGWMYRQDIKLATGGAIQLPVDTYIETDYQVIALYDGREDQPLGASEWVKTTWYPSFKVERTDQGPKQDLLFESVGPDYLQQPAGEHVPVARGTARTVTFYVARTKTSRPKRLATKRLNAEAEIDPGFRYMRALAEVPRSRIPRGYRHFSACFRGTLIGGQLAPFTHCP